MSTRAYLKTRGVFLFGLLALLSLCTRGWGQSASTRTHERPQSPPLMAGTTSRILSNGMKLIVREQHGAPLVAVDLWIAAGSGREGLGESGAAHFLEHLIFKGTPSRKPGEIDAAFEDLGASLGAGTTRDAAHFYSTFASAYLPEALSVLADAVQNARLDEADMERERSVILDEMARDRNDARKQALDRLWAGLYPGWNYARPILGLPESIRTLKRSVVADFHRRWYAPENAALVVVGDVGEAAAAAAAESAFKSWERRPIPDTPAITPPELPFLPGTPVVTQVEGKRSVVAIGARSPSAVDPAEVAAADLVAALLGDSRAGRLANVLQPPGLSVDTGSDYQTVRSNGLLAVYALVEPARASQAFQVMDAELRRLCTTLVSEGELELARRRALGSYLFDIETYGGQARTLGLYHSVGGYAFAQEYASRLRAVSPAALRALAAKYLDPAKRLAVIGFPASWRGAAQ